MSLFHRQLPLLVLLRLHLVLLLLGTAIIAHAVDTIQQHINNAHGLIEKGMGLDDQTLRHHLHYLLESDPFASKANGLQLDHHPSVLRQPEFITFMESLITDTSQVEELELASLLLSLSSPPKDNSDLLQKLIMTSMPYSTPILLAQLRAQVERLPLNSSFFHSSATMSEFWTQHKDRIITEMFSNGDSDLMRIWTRLIHAVPKETLLTVSASITSDLVSDPWAWNLSPWESSSQAAPNPWSSILYEAVRRLYHPDRSRSHHWRDLVQTVADLRGRANADPIRAAVVAKQCVVQHGLRSELTAQQTLALFTRTSKFKWNSDQRRSVPTSADRALRTLFMEMVTDNRISIENMIEQMPNTMLTVVLDHITTVRLPESSNVQSLLIYCRVISAVLDLDRIDVLISSAVPIGGHRRGLPAINSDQILVAADLLIKWYRRSLVPTTDLLPLASETAIASYELSALRHLSQHDGVVLRKRHAYYRLFEASVRAYLYSSRISRPDMTEWVVALLLDHRFVPIDDDGRMIRALRNIQNPVFNANSALETLLGSTFFTSKIALGAPHSSRYAELVLNMYLRLDVEQKAAIKGDFGQVLDMCKRLKMQTK